MLGELILLLGTGAWLTLWLLRDSGLLWSRRGTGLASARRPHEGPRTAVARPHALDSSLPSCAADVAPTPASTTALDDPLSGGPAPQLASQTHS